MVWKSLSSVIWANYETGGGLVVSCVVCCVLCVVCCVLCVLRCELCVVCCVCCGVVIEEVLQFKLGN